jgi:hypothetical protein
MEDDSRRKLEELYDDCHPMIKQLALRSFVPNLAFYTDACLGRKALTIAFCEIMSAIIEFLPADVARKHTPSRAFVTKAHEIAQKLGNNLGFKYDELGKEDDDEDCDCPACTLRRKLVSQLHAAKPKVEVSDLSPDDPSLPADVKEIVEGIKEQGGTPVLQQITAKINFTNPEEWDDAIQKFPAEARPQILRELRKQYRKATGKYAPGDPTIQNQ